MFFQSEAQVHSYTLTGNFKKAFTGKIYLFPGIIDKKYYNENAEIDSANIYDGKFVINRKVYDNNIYPYRIAVKSNLINGTTNLVFLTPINEVIIIDSVNEYISPIINNSSTQKEMINEYDKFFKAFVGDVVDLENYSGKIYESGSNNIAKGEKLKIAAWSNKLMKKGDSLFYEYAKMHTDSYVTLWKLIERFKNLGYKKEYLNIYNLLSENIKKTATASYLLNDLDNAKILGIGSIFPALKLKTIDTININLEAKTAIAKYTLIDFWFSSCAPCLREFSKYKVLYDNYNISGFEIIGISIDNKDDFKKWRKVIRDERLNWINYWDKNGLLSEKLSINSFPTNFLLNAKGEIIAKNISTEKLQILLDSNLKIIDNIDKSFEPL